MTSEPAQLSGSPHSLSALTGAFTWARHLSDDELRAFSLELAGALSESPRSRAEPVAQGVIEGWRATARIKADPEEYRAALRPVEGDYGQVEIVPDA